MNSVSAIVKPMSATMRAKSNAGPSPVLPAEAPVRLDAKADTRVVTDEFLIQNLGPRHREAFKTLIGRAVPEEQVTAAFDDTLSHSKTMTSVCVWWLRPAYGIILDADCLMRRPENRTKQLIPARRFRFSQTRPPSAGG